MATVTTGRLIALAKAMSKGGGGGGSSEEQFAKVYETTVQNTPEMLTIPSTDIGGAYIDMVIRLANSQPIASDTAYGIVFLTDESGEDTVGGDQGTIPRNGDWSIVVSARSIGGLLESGASMNSINGTSGKKLFVPFPLLYPTDELPYISTIGIFMQNGIPTGTTITVYARRKVA